MERCFLIGISAFDFPDLRLSQADFESPVPLFKLVSGLDSAVCSEYIPNGNRAPLQEKISQLRTIFHASRFLGKMKLVCYVNDNSGRFCTTHDPARSGMAAMVFADDQENAWIVFRGKETNNFFARLCDSYSHFLTYLGIVPQQFILAQELFEKVASSVAGNIIVAGDGLGGELALYLYIRKKQKHSALTGMAANAKKRARLWQELDVDAFLSSEDFVFRRSISKNIQADLIKKMLRSIESESRREKEDFYKQTQEIFKKKPNRAMIGNAMELLKNYVMADAVSLWFRHRDSRGDYVMPYVIYGDVVLGLKYLKLREGESVVSTAAFLGVGRLYQDLQEMQIFSIVQSSNQHESMICVPVFCGDSPIGVIQLSKLGEHRRLDEDIYQQVSSFAERFSKFVAPLAQELYYDDDSYFIQIYDRALQKPVFSIMQYEEYTLTFASRSDCDDIVARLMGEDLCATEVLKYCRNDYTQKNIRQFRKMIKKDMGTLFFQEYDSKICLSQLLQQGVENGIPDKLEKMLPYRDFMDKPFASLSIKKKIIFHLVALLVKQPAFVIIYPYPYLIDDKTRKWADSMIHFYTLGLGKTVLKFIPVEDAGKSQLFLD